MTTGPTALGPAPVAAPAPVLGWSAGSARWPLAGLALVLALQLSMVFRRAVNWDEFYHYDQVRLFSEGTLSQPLQTFYVRLFQWLPALPGSGIDHIVVARLVMLGFEIAAAAAIFRLAERFTDRTVGLLCALCYLSAGFVLQHGFSFRADPVDAALLMGALCVLACTRFRGLWLVAFAALLAFAAIYTIKFVLYAPAFAGLAWWRWQEEGRRPAFLYRLLGAGLLAAAIFAGLYGYHVTAGPEVAGSSQAALQGSASKMFQIGVPAYWRFIVKAAMLAPFFTILIAMVPATLTSRRLGQATRVAILGLFLPILVLAVYHNTAPYFYAFILPPVAVACAIPMKLALRRLNPAVLTLAFAGMAACLGMVEDRGIIDRQRALLQAADTIFPDEVAYFDLCGMLGRHSKANAFMTPWGSEIYRRGGTPPMREIMQASVVPLVVENDGMFTRLLRSDRPVPEFLPEDAAALRDTYLPFWGPFWVAGEIIPADAGDLVVEIRVPGPYTLAGGAVAIDGRPVRVGEVVALDRGIHRVTALDGKGARLTWGDRLRRPASPPPPLPFWTLF